jgi:hypothetical protein
MYKKDFNMNIKKYAFLLSFFSFFCVSVAQCVNTDDESSSLSVVEQADVSNDSSGMFYVKIPQKSNDMYPQLQKIVIEFMASQEGAPDPNDRDSWEKLAKKLFSEICDFKDVRLLRKLRGNIDKIRKLNPTNVILDALCKAIMRIEGRVKKSEGSSIPPLSKTQKKIMVLVEEFVDLKSADDVPVVDGQLSEDLALKLKSKWDPDGKKAIRSFRDHIDNIIKYETDSKKIFYVKLSKVLRALEGKKSSSKDSSCQSVHREEGGPLLSQLQLSLAEHVRSVLNPKDREVFEPKDNVDWCRVVLKVKNLWDPKDSKKMSSLYNHIRHIFKCYQTISSQFESSIYESLSKAMNADFIKKHTELGTLSMLRSLCPEEFSSESSCLNDRVALDDCGTSSSFDQAPLNSASVPSISDQNIDPVSLQADAIEGLGCLSSEGLSHSQNMEEKSSRKRPCSDAEEPSSKKARTK